MKGLILFCHVLPGVCYVSVICSENFYLSTSYVPDIKLRTKDTQSKDDACLKEFTVQQGRLSNRQTVLIDLQVPWK